tara:strand:- start:11 stop:124 length:114 start_codon:yes stop_codon:yes gene_type:complete
MERWEVKVWLSALFSRKDAWRLNSGGNDVALLVVPLG